MENKPHPDNLFVGEYYEWSFKGTGNKGRGRFIRMEGDRELSVLWLVFRVNSEDDEDDSRATYDLPIAYTDLAELENIQGDPRD